MFNRFQVPRVSISLVIKQLVADTKTLQWFCPSLYLSTKNMIFNKILWTQA